MENGKYLELVKNSELEISYLSQILSLLDWDHKVYMPKKGDKARSDQTAYLQSLLHEKLISQELWEAVSNLYKKSSELGQDNKRKIEMLHHKICKARMLPKSFVEEMSKTTSQAYNAWIESREKIDFSIFLPHLEKIVELKKQESKYYNIPGHPYDSLLDEFEEGLTIKKLDKEFNALKIGLMDLLKKIKSTKNYKYQEFNLLKNKFSHEAQMALVHDVINRIGLHEDISRIDFSEHPFMTSMGKNNVRITTAIRDNPLFAFSSSIHESGHALYDLNIPDQYRNSILDLGLSISIHESQSRFWENMIGLSKPFWKHYFPKFNDHVKTNGSLEEWYSEVNMVTPSLIRIESDEVHYCLHVILRYEIEKGLLDGSIEVKELPKIWNEKMQEYFGITPNNDKEGVLQDIHWSGGSIGYFPTYALGTIYASQLFLTLKKSYPDIDNDVEKGDYTKISKWLDEKVHKHAASKIADNIIKDICDDGLNVEIYLNYLNKKYKEIYGFD